MNDQAHILKSYLNRLASVVNELLKKADELDRESQSLLEKPKHWALSIERLCSRLVDLGDSLPLIQADLEERKYKKARTRLYSSCLAAEALVKDLQVINLDKANSHVEK